MIKIKVYFVTILVCLFLIAASANAQVLSSAENDFANFIVKADIALSGGSKQSAETQLAQANAILAANQNISRNLQGHFYKVKGKLYMRSSMSTALSYFDISFSCFSDTPSEQARVKTFIGITYFYARDFDVAEAYFNEARAFFISINDNSGLAQTVNNLGILAYQDGDAETAVLLCNQAFSINVNLGESSEAAKNQQNIVYIENNDLSFSRKNYKEPVVIGNGGGGSSGSGTTINTNGGGTIVVSGGN